MKMRINTLKDVDRIDKNRSAFAQGYGGTGKFDPASIAAAILRRDKQIQKILHGTFPIEGGGRTQSTLKSFRRSPGRYSARPQTHYKGALYARNTQDRDMGRLIKFATKGFQGHLNGSSEKGFAMRARGRSRNTHLSWLQKRTAQRLIRLILITLPMGGNSRQNACKPARFELKYLLVNRRILYGFG